MPVLHLAASLGHVNVLGALLSHGAVVDARDGEGWTALHMAADRGHVEAVRRLHAAGGVSAVCVCTLQHGMSAVIGTRAAKLKSSSSWQVQTSMPGCWLLRKALPPATRLTLNGIVSLLSTPAINLP